MNNTSYFILMFLIQSNKEVYQAQTFSFSIVYAKNCEIQLEFKALFTDDNYKVMIVIPKPEYQQHDLIAKCSIEFYDFLLLSKYHAKGYFIYLVVTKNQLLNKTFFK